MKYKIFFALLTFFCPFLADKCFAQNTNHEIDLASKSLWRDYYQDSRVIQSSINYEVPNSIWSADLWLSFSFDSINPVETSTTISYHWSTKDSLDFDFGIIHYSGYYEDLSFLSLPVQNWVELYTSFTISKIDHFPTLEIYYNDLTGIYSSVSFAHEFRLKNTSINLDLLNSYRAFSREDHLHDLDTDQSQYNGWSVSSITLGIPFKFRKLQSSISISHNLLHTLQCNQTIFNLNIQFP